MSRDHRSPKRLSHASSKRFWMNEVYNGVTTHEVTGPISLKRYNADGGMVLVRTKQALLLGLIYTEAVLECRA